MEIKKRYDITNDEVIYASDAHEFVTALRVGSYFDSYGTNAEYMRRFAKRYEVQAGRNIRTDSEANFLEDLIDTGFVVKISDI